MVARVRHPSIGYTLQNSGIEITPLNQPPDGQSTTGDLTARYAEAKRLVGVGEVAEAERILYDIWSANPQEIQALVGLGTIAAGAGNHELAVKRMTSALAIDPDCVPALCWMSYLLRLKGQLDASKGYAEKAVALEPNNPATHIALARCNKQQGFIADAVADLRTAVSLDPNNPGPMYELAEAMMGFHFERDAAEVLERAISLSPTPEGLLRLATLELELDQPGQAEIHCQLALEAKPDLAAGQLLMGRILIEQGRFDEAERYWRRAEGRGMSLSVLCLEKALSLAAIGQFDRAQLELKRSIDANPNQGAAYQAYVFARGISEEDWSLVDKMERALTNLPVGNDRVALLYALGKSFDNLGDYEKAMSFFDDANKLNRQVQGIPPLDREGFTRLIDDRIRLFDRRIFAEWPHPRLESALPLFVVGMIRSGTTLCEQTLSCHSQIWGAGEGYFWADNEAVFVDYERSLIDAKNLLSGAERFIHSLVSTAPGYRYVVDKNPINFLFLGAIHLALPNARIVHTVRNACDNAISIWTTPMKTDAPFVGDRGDIVFAYKQYARLMAHWREVLPANRLLEIRYEDLVAKPDVLTRGLVSSLDLAWEEACLHPEANPRRVKTPSFWQVRQPFYRSSSNRWRNYEPWLGVFTELIEES